MAMSKARQRAQNKWIAKVYDRVNLTLPKGKKELVQKYVSDHGESVNGFINRLISLEMEKGNGAMDTGEQPGNESPIRPETLEKARKSAERTGETSADFLDRAVETQSKRDDRSLTMGINPVERK